jgi:hypothetical protein
MVYCTVGPAVPVNYAIRYNISGVYAWFGDDDVSQRTVYWCHAILKQEVI